MGKSLCFTGHRPEKLIKPYDEAADIIINIKKQLEKHVELAIKQGYTNFYSGVARGIDIIASEIVLNLRMHNNAIKHFAVIPFANQPKGWSLYWKTRYENILSQSDARLCLSEDYYKGCFLDRNAFMVENSQLVIAVYFGGKNGTSHTIDLATKQEKDVVIITKEDLFF